MSWRNFRGDAHSGPWSAHGDDVADWLVRRRGNVRLHAVGLPTPQQASDRLPKLIKPNEQKPTEYRKPTTCEENFATSLLYAKSQTNALDAANHRYQVTRDEPFTPSQRTISSD
jgi:hypothetical protein